MIFNPFEEIVRGRGDETAFEAQTLQDVLEWLDSEECTLKSAARCTYSQAVRKAAKLIRQTPNRIPACATHFQSIFPNKDYNRSWGKTFYAAKRWKRNVSAAINGATGVIAARQERRTRRDEWAALLSVLGELTLENRTPILTNKKQLICIQSCADIARQVMLQPTDLDSSLGVLLYRTARTVGAKTSVVKALNILDAVRTTTDQRIRHLLPTQPIAFVRPTRTTAIKIPKHLMDELMTWVDLASRGRWSITDSAYTGGVTSVAYAIAAKKVMTTAERTGALKLTELTTIAFAFDERVLVAVVRMLRDLDKNGGAGAITPRTARGYLENLIPLLERNGADASFIRELLGTDTWLITGRRNRNEMSPRVQSFCRDVVTDMNVRIRFLSLHIKLRKKAISHLRAAKKMTGRDAEKHLGKARRYGTCAAFAAFETDAIPERASNVLRMTLRGDAAWLCLGHRKGDDGHIIIPAAFVKNRKALRATIPAGSRLRGLETLRWYTEFIRPLFGDHEANDYFFPAVKKPFQPISYATFKSWWSNCAAECGFPSLNPHMFRHGQASILVAQNPGNWSLVAARLGDTEEVCRRNYTWIDQEKLVLAGQQELAKELPNAT